MLAAVQRGVLAWILDGRENVGGKTGEILIECGLADVLLLISRFDKMCRDRCKIWMSPLGTGLYGHSALSLQLSCKYSLFQKKTLLLEAASQSHLACIT